MVQAKNNLLYDAKQVREAKIAELDAKIQEVEVLIAETEKNFDAKLAQI